VKADRSITPLDSREIAFTISWMILQHQKQPLMDLIIKTDKKSIEEWNNFIDALTKESEKALEIAFKSDSIWRVFLLFRCNASEI